MLKKIHNNPVPSHLHPFPRPVRQPEHLPQSRQPPTTLQGPESGVGRGVAVGEESPDAPVCSVAQVTEHFHSSPWERERWDSHSPPSLTGGRAPLRDFGQMGEACHERRQASPRSPAVIVHPGCCWSRWGGKEYLGNPKARALLTHGSECPSSPRGGKSSERAWEGRLKAGHSHSQGPLEGMEQDPSAPQVLGKGQSIGVRVRGTEGPRGCWVQPGNAFLTQRTG